MCSPMSNSLARRCFAGTLLDATFFFCLACIVAKNTFLENSFSPTSSTFSIISNQPTPRNEISSGHNKATAAPVTSACAYQSGAAVAEQ